MNKNKTKALVVLSGGQDSCTCLFWAREKFDEVHAITFDYGQKHDLEVPCAEYIAELAGVKTHKIVHVPGILESTSPLLDNSAELEQYENAEQMEEVIGNRIEKTFVPMRNMLFFTLAMNRAVVLDCDAVVTGICQEDNANYPDCTERFRDLFELVANEALGKYNGTGAEEIRVLAPLIYLSKKDTVLLANSLDGCMNALAYSHTSYDGKYPPTDMNHANLLRAKGFEDAGLPDPLVVRAWREDKMELPQTENYKGLLNG